MFSKFLNLDQDKQDRIINAAIKEFAQKGYDHASTNEIVKDAGISKGLLFHYFGNKKQLYLFLFDYCAQLMTDEFYKKININETDFFARIRQAVKVKMELLAQYPELFKFMKEVYFEDSNEVKEGMEKKIQELNHINFGKIYEGIDYTKFRDDVDIEKILRIITWTFEKLSEEMLLKAKSSPAHELDYESVHLKAEEYCETLATCFYKGGNEK